MKTEYFTRNKVRTTMPIPTTIVPYTDVTILISGVMHYFMNGTPIELHGGDVIVFQPGDVRSRNRGGSAEYYSFNVTFQENTDVPAFHGVLQNCVNEDILAILELYERFYGIYSTHAAEKSNHVFLTLYYTLSEMYNDSKQDTYVSRIKQYAAEHMREPITLEDIGRAVFLSPNYCNYIFKSQTGETITEYILRIKMEQARLNLVGSAMSLTDVAASLGYKQYSYFSRIFKKIIGVSPAEFRRKARYSDQNILPPPTNGWEIEVGLPVDTDNPT